MDPIITEHPDFRSAVYLIGTVFVVAIATTALVQPIKTGVKGFLLLRGWFPEEESTTKRYWREVVRSMSAVVGGLLGFLPIWPAWVYALGDGGWWLGGLLGLGAGISAWRIYDQWIELLGHLPEAAQAWLSRWTGKR